MFHWHDNTYIYRYDPVPGTGHARLGRYIYRSQRTFQERKQFFACPPLLVRGSRRPCNLPDDWDDIGYKTLRSWKKQSHLPKQNGTDPNRIRRFKRQYCYALSV